MTVHVSSLLGQTEENKNVPFSEGGLGEKEGTWWDLLISYYKTPK